MSQSGNNTSGRSESLREFAHAIQKKAGPLPSSPSAADHSEPDIGTDAPDVASSLQSSLGRQPRAVVAGLGIGVGVALGYFLGKLSRKQ